MWTPTSCFQKLRIITLKNQTVTTFGLYGHREVSWANYALRKLPVPSWENGPLKKGDAFSKTLIFSFQPLVFFGGEKRLSLLPLKTKKMFLSKQPLGENLFFFGPRSLSVQDFQVWAFQGSSGFGPVAPVWSLLLGPPREGRVLRAAFGRTNGAAPA